MQKKVQILWKIIISSLLTIFELLIEKDSIFKEIHLRNINNFLDTL